MEGRCLVVNWNQNLPVAVEHSLICALPRDHGTNKAHRREPNQETAIRKILVLPLQRGHGAPNQRTKHRRRQHPRQEHLRVE